MTGLVDNIILNTDSYKIGHWGQYPKGTKHVFSYLEARDGGEYDEAVFVGLQYFLKKYLQGVVVTQEKIDCAYLLAKSHFGNENIFNKKGWQYILDELGGKLPIEIKALPEGTVCPVSIPLMTVVNTDENCFWLTNALESLLLHVFQSITVATKSRWVKKELLRYAENTTDDTGFVDFQLHDFGFRGTTLEDGMLGGVGHLLSFLGTDTLPAMVMALEYYNANIENLAFSVPATEHSVATALGKEGEFEVLDQLLNEYPTGILSVVSDSYDIYNTCEQYGTTFKERILERDGVFVVRPDSGDPLEVMTKCMDILAKHFGYTKNNKGYKVLNPKVRLLWGDGITASEIINLMGILTTTYRWSAENFVFGMGGGLLRKHNRDTLRFAFKCCAQFRDGEWHDVYKQPRDSSKSSKRGRLGVYRDQEGKWTYYKIQDAHAKAAHGPVNMLETVFKNGELVKEYSFDEIRERASL